METKLTLKDLYSFPGFRALTRLKSNLEDPDARVVMLRRHQKKVPALAVAEFNPAITTEKFTAFGTWPAAVRECILNSNPVGFSVVIVMP